MAIPDERQFVIETANKYPREFREAHTGGANTELWIRLLAWELHSQRDQRWGLNGKRGDKNVISQDCVAWKGEGVGSDAHDNLRPMTVVDVIEGAGGNSPKPRWGVFNNPQTDSAPGGATWIMPRPIPGYHDSNNAPTPTDPKEPTVDFNTQILNQFQLLNDKLGKVTDLVGTMAEKVQQQTQTIGDQTQQLVTANEKLERIIQSDVTVQNNELVQELRLLTQLLGKGFVIKAKAGWPVGDVNGTVAVRD
jgi:hypothetical protein